MNTYWISFATDQGPLGCCILDAESQADAVHRSHELKINPGGEVMIALMPPNHPYAIEEIRRFGKNRLITVEELIRNNYIMLGDLPNEVYHAIHEHEAVSKICEKCNAGIEHEH